MAFNSRPAYYQCPPSHHHGSGYYQPEGYSLYHHHHAPTHVSGHAPAASNFSSRSYQPHNVHGVLPPPLQHRDHRPPQPQPEPLSKGGMTFVPTKTATNFPTQGQLSAPPPPVRPSPIRPATLGTGTWTNERPPSPTAVPPPAPAGADSPASEVPLVEDDVASDASSVNLNDTFTRDPYEAQAKREARREERRRQKVAGRQQNRHAAAPTTASANVDPWAEWTVSSTDNSPIHHPAQVSAAAGTTTTTSPIMWTYAPPNTTNTSANTTCLPTPYMSTKNSPLQDALAVPPPFTLPLPIAPVAPTPPAPAAAAEAPRPPTPTNEGTAKPLSYLAAVGGGKNKSVTQWLSSQSQSEPSTKPASANQTPGLKPMKPGALDVRELETTLTTDKATPSKATNADAADLTPEEGRFKTHRYRGPRHCRACRFHSKSLHAQVVLTRDPNLRYKLDMLCKVCNETFEKCVDDKDWQGLWERHCKTGVHYRNALEESPAGKTSGKGRDRVGAQTPAPRSSTVRSDSRNGGANFSKKETTPGLQLACISASKDNEATPDRKIVFGSSLPEPATTRVSRKTPATADVRKSVLGSFTVEADPIADAATMSTHGAIQKPRNAEDLLDLDEEEEVVFMPLMC